MTTKEAIQAMLDGKKVNRKGFVEEVYAYEKGVFFNQYGMTIQGFGDNDDWEIYEEPKPKKTVTIEKWLVKSNFDFSFHQVVQTDSIDKLCYCRDCTKVKLLDTYEVGL